MTSTTEASRSCTHEDKLDPATLPVDHPLRNKPLAGSFYRYAGTTRWREVFPAFGIATVTYNDLGPVWVEGKEWRL